MRAESGTPPVRTVQALTAILAIVYGVWVLRHGLQTGSDTKSYSEWADLMIAHRFNVVAYLRDSTFVVPPVLYLFWVVIVALLKTVLGAKWMHGVVALNWICFSGGTYATLNWIRRGTASGAAVLMAGALYLVAADLLIFVPFVLSDLTFWGLSTAIIVIGLRVAADAQLERAVLWCVAGSALTVVAMMFRPVALPLTAFWCAALITRALRDLVLRFGPILFGALCAGIVLAVFAHAYVLLHPSAWPGRLPAMFEVLGREYRAGVLVYSPDENFNVAPATSWIGFARLTFEKWLYFCTPWLPHYSVAHALMNLAFFAPTYLLAAIAVQRTRRLQASQQLAVWLLAGFALCVSAFHAMVQIDYDHRYRLPLLPVLIMLAALGLEAARRPPALDQRRSRSTE